MEKVIKDKVEQLKYYIEHNEAVYQFCGSLVAILLFLLDGIGVVSYILKKEAIANNLITAYLMKALRVPPIYI